MSRAAVAVAALCALLVALVSGCATSGNAIVRASASVPVEETLTAESAQKRTLPWDKLTLTATADYLTKLPENSPTMDGVTPGLWAAGSRLKARDAGILDLSRQLSRLPACEAPPGESQELNMEQFSERRAELTTLLQDRLKTGAKESAQQGSDGKAQLTLTLPLSDIAQAVLDQGGGFTSKQAVATVFGPRARAQASAKSQAEEKVLRDLLTRRVTSSESFADWVDKAAPNRQILLNNLAQARILRSEEVTDAAGKKSWVYEVELDANLLKRQIQQDGRKVSQNRSRKSPEKLKPISTTETAKEPG